jgi:chromosome segregation ATPase
MRPPLVPTVALLLLTPFTAYAQKPLDPSAIEGRLIEIDHTLQRLVDLLETMSAHQRTDLLLRRTEIQLRRIEPREAALRQIRESRERQSLVLEQLERQIEEGRRAWYELRELPESTPEELTLLERRIQEQDRSRERIEAEIDLLDQQIVELENELSGPRATLRTLEASIDQELLP